MRLVIVDRNRPDVYQRLATRFAREPQVRLMFDRRSRVDVAPSAERRSYDEESNADLQDRGYIVIDILA